MNRKRKWTNEGPRRNHKANRGSKSLSGGFIKQELYSGNQRQSDRKEVLFRKGGFSLSM